MVLFLEEAHFILELVSFSLHVSHIGQLSLRSRIFSQLFSLTPAPGTIKLFIEGHVAQRRGQQGRPGFAEETSSETTGVMLPKSAVPLSALYVGLDLAPLLVVNGRILAESVLFLHFTLWGIHWL